MVFGRNGVRTSQNSNTDRESNIVAWELNLWTQDLLSAARRRPGVGYSNASVVDAHGVLCWSVLAIGGAQRSQTELCKSTDDISFNCKNNEDRPVCDQLSSPLCHVPVIDVQLLNWTRCP